MEPETSIYKPFFQLDDSKSLHEKWLFNHFMTISIQFKLVGWGSRYINIYIYINKGDFAKTLSFRSVFHSSALLRTKKTSSQWAHYSSENTKNTRITRVSLKAAEFCMKKRSKCNPCFVTGIVRLIHYCSSPAVIVFIVFCSHGRPKA